MKRFTVRVITKCEVRYTVDAESQQDAKERVLAGEGEAGNEGYLEPDIFAKEMEG